MKGVYLSMKQFTQSKIETCNNYLWNRLEHKKMIFKYILNYTEYNSIMIVF